MFSLIARLTWSWQFSCLDVVFLINCSETSKLVRVDWARLPSNSQRSVYLCILSVGLKACSTTAWLIFFIDTSNVSCICKRHGRPRRETSWDKGDQAERTGVVRAGARGWRECAQYSRYLYQNVLT